jgi:glyoxylase-like metal-dependent hydrolase (beta-lactamase superfamily II)
MRTQVPLSSDARADDLTDGRVQEVLDDLATRRLIIANVAWIGRAGSPDWVLVDAGVPGTAGTIARISDERFSSPPVAIVLTHGHFDHVGGLRSLAERWNVPVYVHALEVPYVNGTAAYPPPDPTVGGGLMATLSRFYPRDPVDVRHWVHVLPEDGSIPVLPQWRWVHSPGHTPGHISLWRESDRTLIAGDAVITTRQESAYAALTQAPEMHGPPAYYTQDWVAARESAQKLAALEPETLVTGHGHAMRGEEMRNALHLLARDFDRLAVPVTGRYVADPALAEDGTAYPPPGTAKE